MLNSKQRIWQLINNQKHMKIILKSTVNYFEENLVERETKNELLAKKSPGVGREL